MAHGDCFLSHRTHTSQQQTHERNSSGPSQEDPITPCALITTVPSFAPWLPIAIFSPQWVPTQAALVRLCNVPPEKQHNGVKKPVYAPDKVNVPLLT